MPDNNESNLAATGSVVMSRRNVLLSGAMLGGVALMCGLGAQPAAANATISGASAVSGPRKLGSLNVSPVGLGCQWLPGPKEGVVTDFYTSTLERGEAIRLIRSAVDSGATRRDTVSTSTPTASCFDTTQATQPSAWDRLKCSAVEVAGAATNGRP